MLWYPSLEESGLGVAEFVNTIDAACSVDVDPVQSCEWRRGRWSSLRFRRGLELRAGNGASWSRFVVQHHGVATDDRRYRHRLSETLNQIDGSCSVDVDAVTASNGAGPEGPVYAYVVTWACRSGAPAASGPWLSNMVWQPTFADAGIALAELLNQIEATCTVDVDDAISTNGVTADGPLVGFAVSWSCPA